MKGDPKGMPILHLAFPVPPPIGTSIVHEDGQTWTLARVEPYVNRFGQASHVLVWETECVRTGEKVVSTSPIRFNPFKRLRRYA